jgi:hypothetical protein
MMVGLERARSSGRISKGVWSRLDLERGPVATSPREGRDWFTVQTDCVFEVQRCDAPWRGSVP